MSSSCRGAYKCHVFDTLASGTQKFAGIIIYIPKSINRGFTFTQESHYQQITSFTKRCDSDAFEQDFPLYLVLSYVVELQATR